jgi:hypothetical protein
VVGFRFEVFSAWKSRISVPLYRCTDCGFVTTASLENALEAHAVGSSECSGTIALIADFTRTPSVVVPVGRRRRATERSGSGDPDRQVTGPVPHEG